MKSLGKALRVIAEFQRGGRDLSVTEISRTLDIPKSQVSRMLAEFRDNGWLTQDPVTRTYSVGLRAYVVGVRYLSANTLARQALPSLRMAADKSGFASTISILDDFRPLYLFGVESPVFADFGTRMGEHFPMHASAPGKALAAFSPPDIVRKWVSKHGLAPITSNTICEYQDLKRELSRIRERGYAISRGERTPGLSGLAVPVFESDGSLAAVMGLGFPEHNIGPDRFDYYAAILHDSARVLSARLGMKRYPTGNTAKKSLRSPQAGAESNTGAPQ